MANVTGASLAEIYNRLNNAPTYHPMEASTFADWSVEAGDTVTLVRGNDNYTAPVHSANLVWKGAPQMTISSAGSKEREAIAKVGKRKYARGAGMNNDRGLWSFVWNTESTIYSYIDQTATYITMGVEDVANQMGSAILHRSGQKSTPPTVRSIPTSIRQQHISGRKCTVPKAAWDHPYSKRRRVSAQTCTPLRAVSTPT